MITSFARMLRIERVFVKYGLDELFLRGSKADALRYLFYLSPTRWLNKELRDRARGERLRLALEELGPVFVKLGQVLSTRRDLLPDDIYQELALLQDNVKPFDGETARSVIESALGDTTDNLFEWFDVQPMASASIAQVHAAVLNTGESVVVKVLRPGIEEIIDRDVSLMYTMAGFAEKILLDGKRLRPKEVVSEYDKTIHDELDLVREGTNASVLKNNFKEFDTLYIPAVHWDFTRTNVITLERIYGISIRDVDAMHAIDMDMRKLAEHAVEIFYTQVFHHNFFHADMHPGNIFVSSENPKHPQFIAVDFGIVGSLTEEDQRYIGENMLAFFNRDYNRVAQLHVDSGWVPKDTRVSEFESAIRAVCEPIFDKPLAEISFGQVLMQLFQTARRFEMEVQPQLVLLQKTLLNIEGLGRQLYPDLDLWTTGKPFLTDWMLKRNDPKLIGKRLLSSVPEALKLLPEMPNLVNGFLAEQGEQGRQRRLVEQQTLLQAQKSTRQVIVGASVTVATAALSAGWMAASGSAGVPVLGLVGLVFGGILLARGFWQ